MSDKVSQQELENIKSHSTLDSEEPIPELVDANAASIVELIDEGATKELLKNIVCLE